MKPARYGLMFRNGPAYRLIYWFLTEKGLFGCDNAARSWSTLFHRQRENGTSFRSLSGNIADAEDWVVRCYDGQYTGDYFAQNGYVVLSIDALFWGERGRKEGVSYDGQQALASNFMQMGASWGAFINMDDVRSAEFLASLPMIDKNRVGCLGFSMGAYRSWMLAALTDCIKHPLPSAG